MYNSSVVLIERWERNWGTSESFFDDNRTDLSWFRHATHAVWEKHEFLIRSNSITVPFLCLAFFASLSPILLFNAQLSRQRISRATNTSMSREADYALRRVRTTCQLRWHCLEKLGTYLLKNFSLSFSLERRLVFKVRHVVRKCFIDKLLTSISAEQRNKLRRVRRRFSFPWNNLQRPPRHRRSRVELLEDMT